MRILHKQYKDRRKNGKDGNILRLNAAMREHKINYSTGTYGLKRSGCILSRSMLNVLA